MAIITGSTGSGSSGGLTLLSTTTLAVDGTIDVSGITQAYNDLFGVVICRVTNASSEDGLCLRFNNDSGANYDYEQNQAATTINTAGRVSAGTFIRLSAVTAASGTAGYFTRLTFDVLGYTDAGIKSVNVSVVGHEPVVANAELDTSGGVWRNTAAITRITLLGQSTANLLTGSVLRLYGRL